MKNWIQKNKMIALLIIPGVVLVLAFQNCSKVEMADNNVAPLKLASTGNPEQPELPEEVCNGVSCELTPLTNKPAVSTILLTLGDQSNSSLVINGASSQLIAETIIRTSSPVNNPKILAVLDKDNGGEDLEDIDYIMNSLLKRYDVSVIHAEDLTAAKAEGYDVLWYNNPGHPMSSKSYLQILLAFKGGVILQGDDLARGNENGKDFDISELTGLKLIDNGSSVICDGKAYAHDNNSANQYQVSINPSKIAGENAAALSFFLRK